MRTSPSSLVIVIAAALGAVAPNAGTVHAAVIQLKSGDTLPGTIWKVEFAAPITLAFDDERKPNDTVGTLIETSERTHDNATFITFTQTEKTQTSRVSGGLRLNFEAKVTNKTTGDWFGYQLELIDDAPVAEDPEDEVHPPWPHFHPKANEPAVFKPFNVPEERLTDPGKLLLIDDNGTTLSEARSAALRG